MAWIKKQLCKWRCKGIALHHEVNLFNERQQRIVCHKCGTVHVAT